MATSPRWQIIYHQQGTVARKRGRVDDSEDWLRESLAIEEELGNKHGMATSYHELGTTAYLKARLDDAESWYLKALKIPEELGDTAGIVKEFGQLSWLAGKRGQAGEQLEWTIHGVTLFDEFPHPATGTVPERLVRLTRQLGMGALEKTWLRVTGESLPESVREYAKNG